MPKRFSIIQDLYLISDSPKQAVDVLHKTHAKRTIGELNLAPDANACIVIPADEVMLLMGTTSELASELETLRANGVKSFIPGQKGNLYLPRYAGRTDTTDSGGIGISHTVSVILLCGSPTKVNEDNWSKIVGGGSLSIGTLIDTDLEKIKALEKR